MIKLYHWGTLSYATHKATDDLYAKLNVNIDSFVEVMIGKDGKRIDLSHNKSISLHLFSFQTPILYNKTNNFIIFKCNF
jgi:hypothetical protein